MKGNIKKLAVLMTVAAMAMFTVVAMASAQKNNSKVIGEYAVTGKMSCLIAQSGFNGNFIPIDAATALSNSSTFQGIATFEHNGTGTFNTTGVLITPPPVPSPQPPHANAFDFSFNFTYHVAKDDTITIDADKDSFQVTFNTGPKIAPFFTADQYSLSGMVSADHKTLTLGPPTTLIQTCTFSGGGPTMYMICNGSYVFTRLRQGEGEK